MNEKEVIPVRCKICEENIINIPFSIWKVLGDDFICEECNLERRK